MDPSSSHSGETGSNGAQLSTCNSRHKNGKLQQQDSGKRQQFTNKQRIDMYAFCVLELEMHSNKVSIKKQQQAIQRVLLEQRKERTHLNGDTAEPQQYTISELEHLQNQQPHNPQQAIVTEQLNKQLQSKASQSNTINSTSVPEQQLTLMEPLQEQIQQPQTDIHQPTVGFPQEAKTLLELQQEVAITRKCYSDYQKTQVLTSSMLREVQKRFARYYPESAIPSRTTIKHVFEKCVLHGTVENIRTPRKATKIPQGDEIEYLLIHEPQLSLRQMAQKLNVSTGTVSRRCKALGLVPESVTIKHQQLATARRQKQIKQLESQSKQATLVSVSPKQTQLQQQQLPSNGNHESLNNSPQQHTDNVIN